MPRTAGTGNRDARAARTKLSRYRRALIAGLLWIVALVPAPVLAIDDRSPAPPAEPIAPLPAATISDPAKVRLGERLFQDVRLSQSNTVACASCHDLAKGGDDGRDIGTGSDGRPLDFNAPTVFNTALSFRLNWRGNFRTLEEQAEAVLLDPRLMGTTWPELLAKLQGDPGYREAFLAIYGSDFRPEQVLDALAAFERSLLTPRARFDRYLNGERQAITAAEQRGYEFFKAYGCIACHQGANIGGNLFQKFGVFEDPFAGRPTASQADLGRYTLTQVEADRHVFRVPSLRNVEITAPYFHDGSTPTLEEAVDRMARSQLGRTLTQEEIGLIAGFLRTLTGERPSRVPP
jgi:cytochrome c peroxidase